MCPDLLHLGDLDSQAFLLNTKNKFVVPENIHTPTTEDVY